MIGGVVRYSADELERQLVTYSRHYHPGISKGHLHYFKEYLDNLKAATIVIEDPYVDKDYMEDYSAYYVRCYGTNGEGYNRFCARLHFFSSELTESQITKLLLDEQVSERNLTEELGYLGFIVVRPLPIRFIGRTCLKTYNGDTRRYYPSLTSYPVSLFGLQLQLDSLAYQEQDGVVGACATSALWSCFQKTASLFQHALPKPVEITNNTVVASLGNQRAIPSPGFTLEQVAQSIRCYGLEPDLYTPPTIEYTTAIAYAYLKCGIPLFLGSPIYDVTAYEVDGASLVLSEPGLHALAVTGYSLKDDIFGTIQLSENDSVKMVGAGIDRLYVHDDQIGPFSRLVIDTKNVLLVWQNYRERISEIVQNQPTLTGDQKQLLRDHSSLECSMASSWYHEDPSVPNARIGIAALIAPVDKKIRIPFYSIFRSITIFDEIITAFHNLVFDVDESEDDIKPVWDVYLSFSNKMKNEIIKDNQCSESDKVRLLTMDFPRFIWRVTASLDGNRKFELMFDATDLEFSNCLYSGISYDPDYCNTLRIYISYVVNNNLVDNYFKLILESMIKHLGDSMNQ